MNISNIIVFIFHYQLINKKKKLNTTLKKITQKVDCQILSQVSKPVQSITTYVESVISLIEKYWKNSSS